MRSGKRGGGGESRYWDNRRGRRRKRGIRDGGGAGLLRRRRGIRDGGHNFGVGGCGRVGVGGGIMAVVSGDAAVKISACLRWDVVGCWRCRDVCGVCVGEGGGLKASRR